MWEKRRGTDLTLLLIMNIEVEQFNIYTVIANVQVVVRRLVDVWLSEVEKGRREKKNQKS